MNDFLDRVRVTAVKAAGDGEWRCGNLKARIGADGNVTVWNTCTHGRRIQVQKADVEDLARALLRMVGKE